MPGRWTSAGVASLGNAPSALVTLEPSDKAEQPFDMSASGRPGVEAAGWDPSIQAEQPTSATSAMALRTPRAETLGAVESRCMPASRTGASLRARSWFSIGSRYAVAPTMVGVRVLVVEDEPLMAEAIRDGLRLEAIAADVALDGQAALEMLSVNDYDIAVLDRDIPAPSGDQVAESIVASGSGMPILMLTAADRLADKATGFELGADDYLTKPFEFQELFLRLRALHRRRQYSRPPVLEIAGLRLDPFRREVYRNGRYVALTRKQFAVLEVLMQAEGGVVSADELLERAWDENADPFTNAVRITISSLRKRLGEPWLIATVPGSGYRIEADTKIGDSG